MSKDIISSDQQNLILSRLKSQGITNTSVLDIMSTMPRHLFIEPALFIASYAIPALNAPSPITQITFEFLF